MSIVRSMLLLIIMLAICAGNVLGGVSIKNGPEPTFIDADGNSFLAKGIVFYQPQAAHHYFLSKVDLKQASKDFDLFKTYGFNTIVLDTNWGELITRVDDTDNYKPIVINDANVAKLKALVELAAEKELFVYILPLNQVVPMEVEAAEYIGAYDEGGNFIDTFRGFAIKNWQMDPALNKGYLSFLNLLGKTLAPYDNILCYCFSYEGTEQWFPWCHDDDLLIANWRKYLKDRNPDVNFWKQRWQEQGESYSSVDEIIIPYRSREYWKGYYDNLGMTPIESHPQKWRDYYDFMFIKVCYEGKYGLSIPAMAKAIRKGDSDALVMLKNMDPARYAWELGASEEFNSGKPLPEDAAEILKKKFSYPGLDMIACDAYPLVEEEPLKRAQELTFERDLERIKQYKKATSLPIFCQEFGCNHEQWSTYEAAKYIENALEGFAETKLLGYNVWQSHDFYVSPQYGRVQATFGIFGTDGKPNVMADVFADAQGGNPAVRAKSVWDNLLDDERMEYYGYFFHNDVLEHRDEVVKLREYTNMIFMNTFYIKGMPGTSLYDLITGDLDDAPDGFYAKASERIKFTKGLGFKVVSEFFTPFLLVNPDRSTYKAKLLGIKKKVPELDLVDIFYIADEPDINPIQSKEMMEMSIDVMKEVFPNAKSGLCYALPEPRMLDTVPPDNIDILMVDPYFLRDYTGKTDIKDFEIVYRSRFATTLAWVNRWGKPFVMVGDNFWSKKEGGKIKPTTETAKWFYEIAMTQPNCIGLAWFLYGDLHTEEGLRGIWEADPNSQDLLDLNKGIGKQILHEKPSLMGVGWRVNPMVLPKDLKAKVDEVKAKKAGKKLGLSRQGNQFIKDGKPYMGMGVNFFDAFYRLMKDNNDKSYKEGFKILREKYDIPFARVMFSGFWPIENKLYFEDKEKYFELMDELVAEAEKQELGLIPSLFWFIGLVPDMMGENMDAYADPNSKTTVHMKTYIREVVTRYKDSPAIWVWELGNEWMLQADIPTEEYGRVMTATEMGSPAKRHPVKDWVKRNDLRVAYRMFADEVRKIDPTRVVCYGDALTPYNSHNLHFNNSWDVDTKEQWMMMFKSDNVGADCESVHIYPFQDGTYFENKAPIEETIKLCNSTGKPLFIGEFGARAIEGPGKAKVFYNRLIKVILEEKVPLSALWVYDFEPQDGDWSVTHDNDRAYMLDTIVEVNKKFKEMLSAQESK